VAGGQGGQIELVDGSVIQSQNTPFVVGTSLATVEWRIKRSSAVSDSYQECGIRSDTANEVNFNTGSGNSNWFAQTQIGGVSTIIDLGISARTTAWQTLKIVDTGSGVEFYVAGVLRGTITTNLPTNDLFVYAFSNSGLTVNVDYIWVRMPLES
jgi:hypothetical protein